MSIHHYGHATCAVRSFCRRGQSPYLILSVLIILLLGSSFSTAQAQQTLFNVPSADVLGRGEVYGELDVSFKPVEPKFSSFVPRIVVGVGGRVEVGLNITGNVQPGADTTTLVPAVKWKPYDGGTTGGLLSSATTSLFPSATVPLTSATTHTPLSAKRSGRRLA